MSEKGARSGSLYDEEVRTVQGQIFYQYAKISGIPYPAFAKAAAARPSLSPQGRGIYWIACSAFGLSDGREAKKKHYGFIKKTFRELRDGGPECGTCETIQGIHNQAEIRPTKQVAASVANSSFVVKSAGGVYNGNQGEEHDAITSGEPTRS